MTQIHTDESLNGIDPGTELTVSDEKRERGLDYVSKSRLETYIQCPFKFFLKYWCEHRPPGTIHTERGSQIHLAFEIFHENLMAFIGEGGGRPDRFTPLMPDDYNLTSQWMDFIGNFWKFEERRWKEANRSVEFARSRVPEGCIDEDAALKAWEPLEVEAEFWMGEPPEDNERADPDYIDYSGPPVGDIPWMGKADVILPSASVPGVTGNGVVILDYKTGSCPRVKYEGAPFLDEIMEKVFRQCEYYGWMAEHVYDVDAVAIYYPRDDELVVGEYGVKERRWQIKEAALGMQERPEERDEQGVPANFGFEEQNLCFWNNDNGKGACHFYNICPSTAGQ